MTKTEALALVNCSIKELANKLNISHNAISQWKEERIPLAREYQIRDLAKGINPIQKISAQKGCFYD